MAEKSILYSVKKVLGLGAEYTPFDEDVILHINSAFATLHQIGVGPAEGFSIEDEVSEWDQFFDDAVLNHVKSYVCDFVRLRFDPPQTGFGTTAIQERLKEYEWRINVAAERSGNYE